MAIHSLSSHLIARGSLMSITKANIQAMYPNAHGIEQMGSKQLFHVWVNSDNALVLSYETIIGVVLKGIAYVTEEKYSCTTTQHCNMILRQSYSSFRVSAEDLQDKVNEVLA